MINYLDTRSRLQKALPFTDVILAGLAPGGGLFVPERIPQLDLAFLEGLGELEYWQRAARVFQLFELDLPPLMVESIAQEAYGTNFDHARVAPVVALDGERFVLELWHGPTLAFKDMALQCMPLFFSAALDQKRTGGEQDCDFLVLVATSGDTGVAALSGFADRPRTRIAVCYPSGGVSALQERQMITQPGDNVTVFSVEGDFDACQRTVKAVFSDATFGAELAHHHNLRLSSANSINWGRLMPQIAYYISAYVDLAARGRLHLGEAVDFCVPSGNFGNILAAYYAKRMGLPVSRLICASNANHVLADFFAEGKYDISGRRLVKTPSPSMDILVSSNLERLLFHTSGDGQRILGWMQDLNARGSFQVDASTYARLRAEFTGDWVDNKTCLATIARVYKEHGYLLDPHTAVAWEVADRLAAEAPMIVVSTAHWSKFPGDVARALLGLQPEAPLPMDEIALLREVTQLAPGSAVPHSLQVVLKRPVRFTERVAGNEKALEEALRSWLGGHQGN